MQSYYINSIKQESIAHHPYWIKPTKVEYDDDFIFGNEISCSIDKSSDMLYSCYIVVTLPELTITDNRIVTRYLAEYTNAKNNLDIVTSFITLNTGAYRAAYEEYEPINNLTGQSIYNRLTLYYQTNDSTGSIRAQYNTILESMPTLNITKYMSDISKVTDILIQSTNNKETIIRRLELAILHTQKVHKYFSELVSYYDKLYKDTSAKKTEYAWVDHIGYRLFEYINVEIAGDIYDNHTDEWMVTRYELQTQYHEKHMYDKMIGNIPELTQLSTETKPEYKLHIPLMFWFNTDHTHAFPLLNLTYNSFKFNIKIKEFSELIKLRDTSVILPEFNTPLVSHMIADTIYLDPIVKNKFLTEPYDTVIEQASTYKEHIYVNDQTISMNYPTNLQMIAWSLPLDVSFESVILQINDIHVEYDYTYFKDLYIHHALSMSPDLTKTNIYCISFAINPFSVQPSGSVNAARLSTLSLTFRGLSQTDIVCNIMALQYTIIQIYRGSIRRLF